jgi:hypothetical protein
MATLSYAQLEAVWLSAAKGTQYATHTWAALMSAIAEAESGGNPMATNPTDNGGTQTSWGLWQISLGSHDEPSPNWNNPVVNAQLAVGKLQDQGLGAWGTYTSGAYRAYLSGSTTPDGKGIPATSAVDAAAYTASTAALADCAWGINFGGIPGTSWVQDLTGSHGNILSGKVCILSKSQGRAVVGAGLLIAGTTIMITGISILAALLALRGAVRVADTVLGGQGDVQKVTKAAGAAGVGAASARAAAAA